METLNELQKLIDELNLTNSSNAKKATLAKYPQCKEILTWINHPYKQFYVTSANLKKNSDIADDASPGIFTVLEKLSSREVTGHAAISVVNGFINNNPEHRELIYKIIDRNIKTRVDTSLINKVWPNTIPTFDVALANNFDHFEKTVDFTAGDWYASRKLDGVRVITIIDAEGDITFYSRNGKEFTTLAKVADAFKELNFANQVFDGEMCIVDENGDENFSDMIKLIRKKDLTIPNPCYKIFDSMPLAVFEAAKGGDVFALRLNTLKFIIPENHKVLNVVEQIPLYSVERFEELKVLVAKNGWEGLILRKNLPYEGKRSKTMLKVKSFHDAEYVIEDVEMGMIRYIKNGTEVEEEMLSGVKITHKGQRVSVGSGFSMKERLYYYAHPSELLGQTITVKYFEETTNDRGTISLRFPTIKTIHGKKREV